MGATDACSRRDRDETTKTRREGFVSTFLCARVFSESSFVVHDSATPDAATDRDRLARRSRRRFEISLGGCVEEPDARQWARGTARDRRSLGVGRGVRISRGRTLATTVRCALMPEDILEDSLACGDGSGGKVSLSRGRRGLDKSGRSRITRAAETAAPRSPRASIGRAAAAERCTGFRRPLRVDRIRRARPDGRATARHARRTRLENPTVRARWRSDDFPLTSLANRQWRARAPRDARRSARDTGRVSW